MSPIPHPHTPGNMWLARCKYVKHLINPLHFEGKMHSIYDNVHVNLWPCLGLGRYAAEHWIYSHPNAKPCDLSSSDFVWNYDDIPAAGFEMKLESAPRFELKKFTTKPEVCPSYLINTRLAEYKALYNVTKPAAWWWGWKFYDVPEDD
ncbi:hypothetical protein ACHAXR_008136 [Thalassiosira sp. AJA248-18]